MQEDCGRLRVPVQAYADRMVRQLQAFRTARYASVSAAAAAAIGLIVINSEVFSYGLLIRC